MKTQPAEIVHLALETQINATPEGVWNTLTEGIANWWPADFYAGGEEGKRSYVLEARPGGRMYEQWEGGGGVLWGTVICVDPNKRLQVFGLTFPNWGGPVESYSTWELKPTAKGTLLHFSESSVGIIADPASVEKTKGWRFLCNSLKAHIEDEPAPQW